MCFSIRTTRGEKTEELSSIVPPVDKINMMMQRNEHDSIKSIQLNKSRSAEML